ncbi:D-cysteine desulfhydrase 2, mitochondrial-like isoform X2 [Neltuma alba]|uniref:D-cysteine desulfhydrase 2, mitochondrial-like isoform X2 n=1 Tax=Neltuma alba TaxID=207710 RepID=UPI0010A4C80E|nr:D-cysteine desulfhydrase 2, mitochondrial-like isoform X2 [Prosopis alba]
MRSGIYSSNLQVFSKLKLCNEDFMGKLLCRRWTLLSPETKVHQVIQRDKSHDCSVFLRTNPSFNDDLREMDKGDRYFYIVRDDLLHPLINGNKARKLDGVLPLLEDFSVTDVVTCGGCHSAHTAAVAALCAERGIKSHLLLRGEQPDILTGYNLMSTIYGNVTYVPRSIYANREEMLKNHAKLVAGDNDSIVWLNDIVEASTIGLSTSPTLAEIDASRYARNHPKTILIINEGAAESVALLGVIRLAQYLSENHLFGRRALRFVVDAGTGTTAIGLGLAARCLGFPWEVYAVMLADTIDAYREKQERLVSEFKKHFNVQFIDHSANKEDARIVHWVERFRPRKFGKVLEGEMQTCQQVARQTGILVDPVYTLAAWEMATRLCNEEAKGGPEVVMLHTGGTLGTFGLAQRYKNYFGTL